MLLQLNNEMFSPESQAWTSKITALGRAMAAYPLAPRFAKMLLLSQQHDLMQLSITLVAALSVQELMLDQPVDVDGSGETHRKWLGQRRAWAGAGESLLLGDPMVLLRAVGAAEYSGNVEAFCTAHGIRSKALREVRKLRVQLTNETNLILPAGTDPIAVDPRMKPPTELQVTLTRLLFILHRSEFQLAQSSFLHLGQTSEADPVSRPAGSSGTQDSSSRN